MSLLEPPSSLHAPPQVELGNFEEVLRQQGLHAALRFLNDRTSHRFTGVYRYDGDMLRNVALFDRWQPADAAGADAPMSETFCAILPSAGYGLEVADGRTDSRYPWMQANPVVCYCGALMRNAAGEPFGTLCHFDVQRCEAPASQLSLLLAAAPLVYRSLASLRHPPGTPSSQACPGS